MASSHSEKMIFDSQHLTSRSRYRFNKLWRTGLNCDISIHVKEEIFKCNRSLLAAKSTYFNRMFRGSFKESHADEIILHDVDPVIFAAVLGYIYTGCLPSFTPENVFPLLCASEFFLLDHLQKGCFYYIQKNISAINNLIDIIVFAHSANIKPILLKCSDMINFRNLWTQGQFLELSFNELDILLECRRLSSEFKFFHLRNEDFIFNLVMEWINYSPEERSIHFDQLRKYISWKEIPDQYMEFVQQHYNAPYNNVSDLKQYFSNDSFTGGEIGCTQQEEEDELLNPFIKYSFPKEMFTIHVITECYDNLCHKGAPNSLLLLSLNNDDGIQWVASDCHPKIYPKERMITQSVVYGNERLLYSFQAEALSRNPSRTQFSATLSVDGIDGIYHLTTPPCWSRFYNIYAKENDAIYWLNLDIHNELCYSNNNFQIYTHLSEEERRRGIYKYLPEVDIWQSLPEMKFKAEFSSIVADNNLLYMIGGRESYFRRCVQAYDSRIGQWMIMPQTENEYCNAICSNMNGKIYTSNLDVIETYNSRAGRWDLVTDLSNIGPIEACDFEECNDYRKCEFSNLDYQNAKRMVTYNNLLWIFSYKNDRYYTTVVDPYESTNNKCCTSDLLESTILKWQNYEFQHGYNSDNNSDSDNDSDLSRFIFSGIRDVIVYKERNWCYDEGYIF